MAPEPLYLLTTAAVRKGIQAGGFDPLPAGLDYMPVAAVRESGPDVLLVVIGEPAELVLAREQLRDLITSGAVQIEEGGILTTLEQMIDNDA